MKLGNFKGRVAEALVESIFRDAHYHVARVGRESHVLRLAKKGSDEYLPDFIAWKSVDRLDPDLHRLLTVEVKYRADADRFLCGEGVETLSKMKGDWPNLCFVLVTNSPSSGQSFFQAIFLRDYTPRTQVQLVDLHRVSALGIAQSTVEEHQDLARRLFFELVDEKILRQREQWEEMRRLAPRHASRT
jgi:hypothetical protein